MGDLDRKIIQETYFYVDPEIKTPYSKEMDDLINYPDRLPMSVDILAFEHFLFPRTLIVVDGRTANARFLKTNLQRNWDYYHSEEYEQHFFELKEAPIGIYNKRQIEFCLGPDW